MERSKEVPFPLPAHVVISEGLIGNLNSQLQEGASLAPGVNGGQVEILDFHTYLAVMR